MFWLPLISTLITFWSSRVYAAYPTALIQFNSKKCFMNIQCNDIIQHFILYHCNVAIKLGVTRGFVLQSCPFFGCPGICQFAVATYYFICWFLCRAFRFLVSPFGGVPPGKQLPSGLVGIYPSRAGAPLYGWRLAPNPRVDCRPPIPPRILRFCKCRADISWFTGFLMISHDF